MTLVDPEAWIARESEKFAVIVDGGALDALRTTAFDTPAWAWWRYDHPDAVSVEGDQSVLEQNLEPVA